MRIIHVVLGKANPESMNGVNKVVHYLATEQHRMGFEVEVWGITFSKDPPTHEHEYNLRVFRDSRLRFYLCSELRRGIKELNPDTWVQLHSVFIPEFFRIGIFLDKLGIPYGFTPHGGYSRYALRRNWVLKRVYLVLFESFVLRNAKLIHAIGQSEVGNVLRIVKHKNIVLVPNGQDIKSLNFHRETMFAERPLFGFCGRLDAQHKGLDLLIEGFAIYKRAGGTGALGFVGDGVDGGKVKSLAEKLKIGKTVKFFGAKFGQEKLQVIDNFDVFVHTSRWDGIPTACLEAAALGKPLLISKETNLGPFVQSYLAGWVLAQNIPGQISNALFGAEKEFKRGDLKDYGERARRMVEREFTWTEIAKKLVEAYQCAKV